MRATQQFKEFFASEKAGGLVLIACTAVSLLIANSALGLGYHDFWMMKFGGLTLEHWVNDGLMAVFFLLVGLELEREIYTGELSNPREALLPMFGALGGILFPAAIFLAFNVTTTTRSGAGIPMATDIAFTLGILSLLGSHVPTSLKIFLTALAIMDDLCAILVIALFYSKGLVLSNLLISLGIFAVLVLLNRLKVRSLVPYVLGGLAMWYFMLHSGVHATITGVLLAFAIPFGDGGRKSPSYTVQHFLHKPVSFGILPVFALVNTIIMLRGNPFDMFLQPYGTGIALGLLIGKPAGIITLTYLAVKARLCSLPAELSWKHIFGVGILGGIGFTMSIFITLLAFDDPVIVNNAKLVILLTSLTAGILGYLVLNFYLKTNISTDEQEIV
jgi:NhaA family Na+:H+ antiporter